MQESRVALMLCRQCYNTKAQALAWSTQASNCSLCMLFRKFLIWKLLEDREPVKRYLHLPSYDFFLIRDLCPFISTCRVGGVKCPSVRPCDVTERLQGRFRVSGN
jgi:hypothetical protein